MHKHKHNRCLYDVCNFGGNNAGAWADLYGVYPFGLASETIIISPHTCL